MKLFTISASLILLFSFFCCVTEPTSVDTSGPVIMPTNPNGDSELALLMRDMYDNGMKVKAKIQQREIPELLLEFEKIHTAKATEPEKAASPEYKVHALSYLQAVESLKKAQADHLEVLYANMVDACMNCHRALCPGPMVRINKMYL